jgi:hypothetical protein
MTTPFKLTQFGESRQGSRIPANLSSSSNVGASSSALNSQKKLKPYQQKQSSLFKVSGVNIVKRVVDLTQIPDGASS